jgi:hypothetical protein
MFSSVYYIYASYSFILSHKTLPCLAWTIRPLLNNYLWPLFDVWKVHLCIFILQLWQQLIFDKICKWELVLQYNYKIEKIFHRLRWTLPFFYFLMLVQCVTAQKSSVIYILHQQICLQDRFIGGGVRLGKNAKNSENTRQKGLSW